MLAISFFFSIGAKVWRYDPQSEVWSESDTLAYVGDKLQLGHKEGNCRDAYKFKYLNQDETLGR